ncbi:KXD1 [Candida pseudojiufengensis]|uniref:KXD1 n=1 Tax=Candida pseudojiufengensis TaxID=497109 RepID=UPI00222504C4|nr:KXD1 [Candida pseudojiufengensis]KAI5960446.1 KXD1 [Candida pseudojiufengensis]
MNDEELARGIKDSIIDEEEPIRLLQPTTNSQIPIRAEKTSSIHDQSLSTDTEDEYFKSDEDKEDEGLINEDSVTSHLPGISNLGDYAKYFTNSILQSLDSTDLDNPLVIEAQISGSLNNENQKSMEKKSQLQEKLRVLHGLFEKNFTAIGDAKGSRMDQLNHDIQSLERRINRLKHGEARSLGIPFIKSKNKAGVIDKFPIEYYQAKDKVLDRES